MKTKLFIALFCISATTLFAQKPVVDEQLIGRWELCTLEGKVMETPNVRQKIYTKNSYVVLEVNKEDSVTVVDFIGTLTAVDESKITETPVYSNSKIKYMLSRGFNFFYKIEGDRLYLKGIDNSYNEIWVRISN